MKGLYKTAPKRMESAVELMKTDALLDSNNEAVKPVLDKLAVGFDKVAYQREYMRKRRAAAKCK